MDITVYLPDDIGKFAKSAGLNLSAMLRQAVIAEKRRRAALKVLEKEVQEFTLDLETPDGDVYTGVLRGRAITEERGGYRYFQTTDGRVMVYIDKNKSLVKLEKAGDPEQWASMDDYIAVANALGEDARVEV
jgi:hypothetical protein